MTGKATTTVETLTAPPQDACLPALADAVTDANQVLADGLIAEANTASRRRRGLLTAAMLSAYLSGHGSMINGNALS
jgi:hypothetical protein